MNVQELRPASTATAAAHAPITPVPATDLYPFRGIQSNFANLLILCLASNNETMLNGSQKQRDDPVGDLVCTIP